MDGTTHGYAPCANGGEMWDQGEEADSARVTGCAPVLLDQAQPITSAPVPPSHPERHSRSDWPLYNYLEYGPLLDSVPTARARTKAVLHEWGPTLADLVDDTLLVVSELVGNAVTASRTLSDVRPLRLWLRSDWASVLVMVGDESPRSPLRLVPSLDAEHGRGLVAVEGVSSRWGWYPATSYGLAKVVWALVGGATPMASATGAPRELSAPPVPTPIPAHHPQG
jgi:hypothetical protein